MKQLTNVWNFLKGKKSYIITLGATVYGWGVAQGLWHNQPLVDLFLGSTWAASMRHAIATANGTEKPGDTSVPVVQGATGLMQGQTK